MADIHAFRDQSPPANPRLRSPRDVGLTSEAIRRGVQYLAFRAVPRDLVARYEPGPEPVNGRVARAAHAALKAHQQLSPNLVSAPPSPTRSAALAARLDFARQLAEVKSALTRAPTTALRSAYLDALANLMIETVRRNGGSAFDAAD
jgi:hypothetical protein